jgi:sugar lactone lactonase YvrE
VLGLTFDRWGRLYALENTVCPTADPCMPTPGTGALVRVRPNGDVETVVSGLMFPTGMTLGPDGAFYVSVNGFGFPPGAGEVARITLGY